jgi:predicted nucleic acid-binding Zn finger protein
MVTAAQAKAISERYLKAVELVASGKVPRLYGGREGDYVVVNGNGQAYLVNLISGECTCPDSQYRCARYDILCKHALAVKLYQERRQAGESPAPQPAPAGQPEDDDLPASWCQGCGVAIAAGRLYAACEASARALLAHLQ